MIRPAAALLLVLSRQAEGRRRRPLNRAERRASTLVESPTTPGRFVPVFTASRGRHVYAGTVPAAEVARRRAANKVARRSRRVNRGRA